jgi:SAM-dependent methyltransferase
VQAVAEFDEYKNHYEASIDLAIAFAGKSHAFYTKAKADCLIGLIKAKLGGLSNYRVLDIGCGNGAIHEFLLNSELEINLEGIDVAPEFLEQAHKNFPGVNYRVYDGKRLPFDDGSFDCVFTICVMHHVPPAQWPGFVQEMHRVVRPGGIVVVVEHNRINPLTTFIVKTCPLDRNAVLVPVGALRRHMSAAGLMELESRYILFSPFDHRFVRAVEGSIGWLPLGAQYVCVGERIASPV